jgi:AcrR family transcriptional regulator
MPNTRAEAEDTVELKEACVRAAREVIAEHGIEQLSLREVSRKLGVSHQAPYKHYPSRDHLLAEVMRRCFQDFAEALDARPRHADPVADLESLGRQYLAYAAAHALEYRLMFGSPWPQGADHPGLARDALHAFDVLRGVLRRLYGAGEEQRAEVDRHAMFIWSTVHGLASIRQACALEHLQLAAGVDTDQIAGHTLHMIERALRAGG